MAGFHVAEPNEALLVSGRKAKEKAVEGAEESMRFRIVTGERVWVWPIIQSVRSLSLDLRQTLVPVFCHTTTGIPVEIKGVVAFKVGADFASIANAAQRFLGDPDSMDQRVHELFAGHVRAIVGSMTVEQLIRERETLTLQARESTGADMEKMGLVIDSLQIAEVGDPSGYIENLAKPQLAVVNRDARMAESENNREAAQKEAEQNALVAEAQRQSEIQQAEAQAEVDRVQAEAEQAGPLATAEAQQAVVQKQTEVAQLTALRRERELESEVRRPADAQAYATAKQAEGQRNAAIMAAEAQAEQTKRVGGAEADVIRSKGEADGDALKARAEGLRENQEAVIGQQIAENLPEMIAAAAHVYDNVKELTVLDGADGMQRSLKTVIGMAGEAWRTAQDQFATSQDGDEQQDRRRNGTSGVEDADREVPHVGMGDATER